PAGRTADAPLQAAVSGPPPPGGDEARDPLAALERNPRAANAGDLLGAVRRRIDEAMRLGRAEQALHLLAGIVRCEQLVPDGDQRRVYGAVLKRILTKPMLEALAQLVTAPAYGADAVAALQRAGASGVEVLLDLLVAAPTVAERQAVFGALAEMKEGTDQLVHLLGHSDWFVVRNVAELVGELALEEAVPALAQQLDHEDERVRKAVALALAKIGNRAAAEPLRRALRDESPAVRMQAALGVGGRKAGALAMPLVVAMEEEEDAEVERELILALGRIGSSDAVQALIKFAQPAGRLFRRRPVGLRAAAVEALRVAATPAAVGMLQGLAEDADKQVRVAAQEALKDLKR
ncbi:MAG: HEAT repeat domain-containing protein, partial [Gemmatimonadales bacterium]